jgi:hypothetical protein
LDFDLLEGDRFYLGEANLLEGTCRGYGPFVYVVKR